jgi:catechol-2,3-dioxygenase
MIRPLVVALVLVLAPAAGVEAQGLVRAVGPIGMTVGNMERSIAFYSRVLDFEKVSDVELWGPTGSGCRESSGCACAWCACGSARRRSS